MWTLNEPRLTGKFLKRASTSRTVVEVWPRRNNCNGCLDIPTVQQISQYSKPSFYNMLEKGWSNQPCSVGNAGQWTPKRKCGAAEEGLRRSASMCRQKAYCRSISPEPVCTSSS